MAPNTQHPPLPLDSGWHDDEDTQAIVMDEHMGTMMMIPLPLTLYVRGSLPPLPPPLPCPL